MKRRSFIKNVALGGSLMPMIGIPQWDDLHDFQRLVILHTNDMHSRIDPFPMDGGRNEGRGGVLKRSAMINKVRRDNKHVLLFDSGDIFQGTPYFNLFGGEVEIKSMSAMKYDASTMGNHDFDGGIDGFEKQLKHASFPFVISNYDLSQTILAGKMETFKIFQKGNIKVGIYGIGIELDGLVPQALYQDTKYLDPIEVAREYEKKLREEIKCDLVICLSHLGFRYRDDKVSDIVLAKNTFETDAILGGHTHTFLNEPEVVKNRNNRNVLVNQAGWGGIVLGRLDFYFGNGTKGVENVHDNVIIY